MASPLAASRAIWPPPVLPSNQPLPLWLTGQKALVTGASSGIGKAVALALGEAGADVLVNFVGGEQSAVAVVDAIRASGRKAEALRADVSDERQVEAMFRTMIDTFGTIDILVNNAGIQRD